MYIIGIDEVGRGSLAGPVVVAAVALPVGARFKNLKDSKKLSAHKREEWFAYVKSENISYTVARVYPKGIDTINISGAANLAAAKSFSRLLGSLGPKKQKNLKIFLDGGLYLTKSIRQLANKSQSANWRTKTIIKGDEKINAIKLASIVAKVTRDRYMTKLHEFYPKYEFRLHKGYGTKAHIKAIRRHGYSDVHRKSFKIK